MKGRNRTRQRGRKRMFKLLPGLNKKPNITLRESDEANKVYRQRYRSWRAKHPA